MQGGRRREGSAASAGPTRSAGTHERSLQQSGWTAAAWRWPATVLAGLHECKAEPAALGCGLQHAVHACPGLRVPASCRRHRAARRTRQGLGRVAAQQPTHNLKMMRAAAPLWCLTRSRMPPMCGPSPTSQLRPEAGQVSLIAAGPSPASPPAGKPTSFDQMRYSQSGRAAGGRAGAGGGGSSGGRATPRRGTGLGQGAAGQGVQKAGRGGGAVPPGAHWGSVCLCRLCLTLSVLSGRPGSWAGRSGGRTPRRGCPAHGASGREHGQWHSWQGVTTCARQTIQKSGRQWHRDQAAAVATP